MADNRRHSSKRRDMRPEDREFEQKLIDIARVTRVMAGGKRMRFRACVVVGDNRGRLGFGVGKGADVTIAINKAVTRGKRDIMQVPIINGTIPHEVRMKYKAARLLLKPAPQGTGVVAGGAVRSALEVSGIDNIVAKVYGSKNKINNIKALFDALLDLSRTVERKQLTLTPKKKEQVSQPEAVGTSVERKPRGIGAAPVKEQELPTS